MKGLNIKAPKYDVIVGTGGIGSGILFSLEGDHLLGREESRLGKLEPYKDFCKQHIILHYIALFLNSGKDTHVFPIGEVGSDEIGQQLLQQMQGVGMNTDFVGVSDDERTLYSVCFQYPDFSGGNITTSNSASALVDPTQIAKSFAAIPKAKTKGLVMAAPEVSVAARVELLKQGRANGFFNTAAIASAEIEEFLSLDGFALCDLLSINIDEAYALSGIEADSAPSQEVVEACMTKLKTYNKDVILAVTDGAKGSYCCQYDVIEFTPILKTEVASTAGAGDSFMAGTIVGLTCGLPLFRHKEREVMTEMPITTAIEFATVLASLCVTSPDTINLEADAKLLKQYAEEKGVLLSPEINTLLSK